MARRLDRTGDGIVYGDAAIVTVLVDVYGTGSPNLALELDRDGDDDGRGDFGDEQPLPEPVDIRHARPALRCTCPVPSRW